MLCHVIFIQTTIPINYACERDHVSSFNLLQYSTWPLKRRVVFNNFLTHDTEYTIFRHASWTESLPDISYMSMSDDEFTSWNAANQSI